MTTSALPTSASPEPSFTPPARDSAWTPPRKDSVTDPSVDQPSLSSAQESNSGVATEPDERTAIATEDIAFWTAVDGIGGLFTALAAFFAFLAFRQTKRQANAAERQVDEAKRQADEAKRQADAADLAAAASNRQAEASIEMMKANEGRHKAQMESMAKTSRPIPQIKGKVWLSSNGSLPSSINIHNPGPTEMRNIELYSGARLAERAGKELAFWDIEHREPLKVEEIGPGKNSTLKPIFGRDDVSPNYQSPDGQSFDLQAEVEIRWTDSFGQTIIERYSSRDANASPRNMAFSSELTLVSRNPLSLKNIGTIAKSVIKASDSI